MIIYYITYIKYYSPVIISKHYREEHSVRSESNMFASKTMCGVIIQASM